jgi:twitching motility protein PilT
MVTMHQLLEEIVEQKASDLHITAGVPPIFRVDGEIRPSSHDALAPEQTEQLIYSVLREDQRKRFEQTHELDLSFGVKGLARFRANIFRQRGAVAGAFRVIPFKTYSFSELGLPNIVNEIVKKPAGLILITGPTGCGKSTTLTSIIDKINVSRNQHIVTVEDPIEYLHAHKGCLINQREIGRDSISFKRALKYILRQDPDVVLIGEMRDLETVEAALTIAETGHLAFGTLHTNNAIQSINRIIDVFPSHAQSQVRAVLSFVLEGVITQQLIPKASGSGRAMASEVMIPNAAIRNLIREDKLHQIYSQMQIGQTKFGMQTMNQSLLDLYMRKVITVDEALGHTSEIDELRTMIMNQGGGGGSAPPQPRR